MHHLTTQRIISLVAAELFGKPIEVSIFEDMDYEQWKELFEVASPHSQSLIALDGMKYLPKEFHPSATFMIAWELDTKRSESGYTSKVATLESIANVFCKNGLKIMVLKGIGLASYYPIPKHRTFGDIDIYLFGEWKKGDILAETELGAKVKNSKYENQTKYTFNNTLIENHREFFSANAHSSNKEFERLLQKLVLKEGETITIGSKQFFLPPADFNALFLIRHAATHFANRGGLELRHICDWGMFLRHHQGKIDWPLVEATFKKYNIFRFVNILNTILTEYFGMDETLLPPFEHERELAKKVFDDIMSLRNEIDDKNLYRRAKKFYNDRWKQDFTFPEGFLRTLLRSAWSYLKA